MAVATAYLARENVEFVACNTDSTFPAIPGLKLPGAGRLYPPTTHLPQPQTPPFCFYLLIRSSISPEHPPSPFPPSPPYLPIFTSLSVVFLCLFVRPSILTHFFSIVAAVATASGRKPTVMTCGIFDSLRKTRACLHRMILFTMNNVFPPPPPPPSPTHYHLSGSRQA